MSEVSVCNEALGLLSAGTISTLAGSDKVSEACAVYYATSRDTVLEASDWRFATHAATLAADASGTDGAGLYDGHVWRGATYQLPSDYIRAIEINTGLDDENVWRIMGRFLVTSTLTPILTYIRRVEDVTAWSPGFRETVAAKIASNLAYALPEHRGKFFDMQNLYQQRLADAARLTATSGGKRKFKSTKVRNVRSR